MVIRKSKIFFEKIFKNPDNRAQIIKCKNCHIKIKSSLFIIFNAIHTSYAIEKRIIFKELKIQIAQGSR